MILALDIGGTAIKVGQLNENGELYNFNEFPHDGKQGGQALVEKVYSIIASYENYEVICVSSSGQVDSETGTITFANENIPGYTGTHLKKLLEEQFHVPAFIENDVNCAALGELHFGAGHTYSDFLCVTYGTGIGGAIMINRELYKGRDGVAGEMGHILTHLDGLPCNCGSKGCYESYASTTALIKKAMTISPYYTNGVKVFEAYKQGHEEIVALVEDWVNEIAIGLVSLVHIFNPAAIVIGGGIMEQQLLVEKIDCKVKAYIMPSFSKVRLVKAQLGNKAGLYGAASLYLKRQ